MFTFQNQNWETVIYSYRYSYRNTLLDQSTPSYYECYIITTWYIHCEVPQKYNKDYEEVSRTASSCGQNFY